MKVAKLVPNIEYLMEQTGSVLTACIQSLSNKGFSCQLDNDWNIIVINGSASDLADIEKIVDDINDEECEKVLQHVSLID